MKRAEMRELGAGGQVQKLDRLRQLQERRRGEQEIVGQREDEVGSGVAVGLKPLVIPAREGLDAEQPGGCDRLVGRGGVGRSRGCLG